MGDTFEFVPVGNICRDYTQEYDVRFPENATFSDFFRMMLEKVEEGKTCYGRVTLIDHTDKGKKKFLGEYRDSRMVNPDLSLLRWASGPDRVLMTITAYGNYYSFNYYVYMR